MLEYQLAVGIEVTRLGSKVMAPIPIESGFLGRDCFKVQFEL